MISLALVPDFFPVLLLPLYWIFWLSFYLFYCPVYFFIWIFSPYRSRKTALAYYSRKAKKDKRLIEYSKAETSETSASDTKEEEKSSTPSDELAKPAKSKGKTKEVPYTDDLEK